MTSGQTPWAAFGAVLRIWRDRRGISLRRLAEQIRWDHSVIARWEQGRNPPSADAIKALEGALDTGGELTEVALRAQAMEVERLRGEIRRLQGRTLPATPQNAKDDEMERRAAMQVLAALGTTAVVPPSAIQTILSGVNRAIGDRDDFGLDEWERTVWEYGFRTNSGPLGALIGEVTADIVEVKRLLDGNPTSSLRTGLLRTIAGLNQVLAGELTHMQAPSEARQAHATARRAADASGDRDLRVAVRAGQAWNAFASGEHPRIVLRRLDDALRIAGGAPSAGLANAHAGRAFVLASQAAAGRSDEDAAVAALHDLRDVFERLPGSATEDELSIWGFAERALRFSEAHTFALTGHKREAEQAIAQAFVLYPPELVHGLANLRLIQAYTLIRDHDVPQGLDHAMTSLQGPPITPARRQMTGQVINGLPEKARTLPAAQELRATLAASSASLRAV
ncbi:helix-turn-helix transcriptional regulator [Thermopolyspora sp. NPDC052614]|uniref:helix-turn-helix transcriptional regulator n=1 Tax=Thermopolyspora sp. NPDC052614 TaxID=3155682 RepID=UPI003445C11B